MNTWTKCKIGTVAFLIALIGFNGYTMHTLNKGLEAEMARTDTIEIELEKIRAEGYTGEIRYIEVCGVEDERYPLTDKERDLVERVIAAEARGDSYEGMIAVATVIRNRAELWDRSVTEVLTAPYQFASPYQGDIDYSVKDAVFEVFDSGVKACTEPITHFHSGTAPYWTEDKTCVGTLGSGAHLFYY